MKYLIVLMASVVLLAAPAREKIKLTPIKKWQWAYDKVVKWQPKLAQRYANVYTECHYYYEVPIEILVGLGETESHFNWKQRGDGGLSWGTHQIKIKFKNHRDMLAMCDYDNGDLGKLIAKKIKRGDRIPWGNYMRRIGYNTQTCSKKLKSLYKRYNDWNVSVLAYGCGESSDTFNDYKKGKLKAENYPYVKKAMRYYKK